MTPTGNSNTKWATAGLVYLDAQKIDIVKLAARAAGTLERLDTDKVGVKILSDHSAALRGPLYEMMIDTYEDVTLPYLDQQAKRIVSVHVAHPKNDTLDHIAPETVLMHLVKALHGKAPADHMQWLKPDVVLSGAEFLAATSSTKLPARRTEEEKPQQKAAHLPGVEDTNDRLQDYLIQDDGLAHSNAELAELRHFFRSTDQEENTKKKTKPDSIREKTPALRLSVWMISFTIALFALPVGVALIVINLLKGENLRLASQAAALTGTFISLQTYGTAAQAMGTLNALIG